MGSGGTQRPPTDRCTPVPRSALRLPRTRLTEGASATGECGVGSALFKLCPCSARRVHRSKALRRVTEWAPKPGASGQRAVRAAKTTWQAASFLTRPSVLWADMSPGPSGPGTRTWTSSGLHLPRSRGTLPCRSARSAHTLSASTTGIPQGTREAREREHLRATRAINTLRKQRFTQLRTCPSSGSPFLAGLGCYPPHPRCHPVHFACPEESVGAPSASPLPAALMAASEKHVKEKVWCFAFSSLS